MQSLDESSPLEALNWRLRVANHWAPMTLILDRGVRYSCIGAARLESVSDSDSRVLIQLGLRRGICIRGNEVC